MSTSDSDPGALPAISSPGLVGRERELGALKAALCDPSAVVLVEGEAGIGKSRLLQELLAAHTPTSEQVLLAACPAVRQPFTLGPMVDAIRSATEDVARLGLSDLAGVLRPLFPEWASVLPPTPDPPEDAAAARHRLFRAIEEILERLEIRLLAVEDVHWADEATLEFLLFLTSRPGQRISLLVSYRPEDVAPDSLLLRLSSRQAAGGARLRLSLEALDVPGTAGMVSSMLGGEQVSDEFATFLHDRTDGLPLAIEESVRLMWNRSGLTRRDGSWGRHRLSEIDVPPTVRDAVLERSARLGPAALSALHAVAVLTGPSPEGTVIEVMTPGDDPASRLAGLAEAVDSRLLREDPKGLVSFRHMLACRAVYESLPGPQRRALHLRAARVLEGVVPPPVARLAHHFREAGDTTQWCRYAECSAELALASGDDATVIGLVHDLLTNADLPPADVLRLTGKVPFCLLSGHERYRELMDALRLVLDTGGPTRSEAGEIRFHVARLLQQMELFEESRIEMERALPDLGHDPAKAARAMIFLGLPYGTTTPAAEHLRWLRRVSRAPISMAPGDRMSIRVGRASALLVLGEEEGWAEAALVGDDAPTTAERQQIMTGQLNIGHMALVWGRYPEARRALTVATGLADRYQYRKLHRMGQVTLAQLDWLTGDWDGLADRAASLAGDEELLQPVSRLAAAMVTGLLSVARGDLDSADDCLRLVLEQADRHGGAEYSIEPAGALAGLRLGAGRIDDALRLTDEPIRFLERKGTWIWATGLAPVRCEALVMAGRDNEARDLADALAAGLRDRRAPGPHAALSTCRAILARSEGDHLGAAALFARAAEAWQAISGPYDALLSRERQAGCLLRADRSDEALPVLTETFQGLSALGARGDAERVMRTLRASGVGVKRPSWHGGRRSYGNELSPRELDVVRLLVGGRTNREIAGVLILSPKTVARHVEGAMRKLEVSSRTALAVKVVEAGVVADSPADARR
ncbi:helix-turn-helix transcriptional regulator [Streptomyces sp. NBC_01022]|uniref:helix-turn-helix transcriptional regulator n=1 Tax=Streptomyces sp. NBC_01022 TaxID=2903723 RepID=UPI002DDC5ABB|nr:AAA family ATPase [Streptomyces sp. NBC_01022]WRZ85082.1 AAA family ATPase [Streptomyces sp. NBC_01022]